jgi:hypothetical protein
MTTSKGEPMYGYGAPVKAVAAVSGGGTLALTGAASGSWFLAGFGMVILGALVVFVSMRARRS